MYSGHARLCVCLSLVAFPHYCTDPDVTWGNGRGAVVVYYWANLQSVHRFRCYDKFDNIARTRNVIECSVLGLCLVPIVPRFGVAIAAFGASVKLRYVDIG